MKLCRVQFVGMEYDTNDNTVIINVVKYKICNPGGLHVNCIEIEWLVLGGGWFWASGLRFCLLLVLS